MNILAIESSCDETAASIIKDGTTVIGSAVASSKDVYEKWGGIVPEIAAREQVRAIMPVLQKTLSPLVTTQRNTNYIKIIQDNIDAIAATIGPGLKGSLLVGVETAKTLAYVTNKPIIPVNHVVAHMYANFISKSSQNKSDTILFPAISLVVSGGHTELYLMKTKKDIAWLGGTVDDAAGEAFDKLSRSIGLGNGGGAAIEKKAHTYKKIEKTNNSISLPRPMIKTASYSFSFSGLKTATLREIKKITKTKSLKEQDIRLLAYEIQAAITDVLVSKTIMAANNHKAKSILISGGVASNNTLRQRFKDAIKKYNQLSFFAPEIKYCTDNAAYIGACAYFRYNENHWSNIYAKPSLHVEVTS